MSGRIQIRRIYDKPDENDGYRILVDRLWPRGIRKENAHLDEWQKDAAPSSSLRKRFHADHDFASFQKDYQKELMENTSVIDWIQHIRTYLENGNVTFLTAVRDPLHSNAAVLAEYVHEKIQC